MARWNAELAEKNLQDLADQYDKTVGPIKLPDGTDLKEIVVDAVRNIDPSQPALGIGGEAARVAEQQGTPGTLIAAQASAPYAIAEEVNKAAKSAEGLDLDQTRRDVLKWLGGLTALGIGVIGGFSGWFDGLFGYQKIPWGADIGTVGKVSGPVPRDDYSRSEASEHVEVGKYYVDTFFYDLEETLRDQELGFSYNRTVIFDPEREYSYKGRMITVSELDSIVKSSYDYPAYGQYARVPESSFVARKVDYIQWKGKSDLYNKDVIVYNEIFEGMELLNAEQ